MATSVKKSVPVERTVHGIKVEKLPIGRYLKAIETVKDFPETVLKAAFPVMNEPGELLPKLQQMDADTFLRLAKSLIVTAPVEVIKALAAILDIDEAEITDRLTPIDLLDVIEALVEVNDLGNFMMRLRTMLRTGGLTNAGCSS